MLTKTDLVPPIQPLCQTAAEHADELELIGLLWRRLSADQRAAFCAEFEADIWSALEHVADAQRK